MPIAKIRDLGKFGVITDVDAFDLPLGAFSMGVNVRFDNNRCERGPVFRRLGSLTNQSPRHVYSYKELGGSNVLLVANSDGTIVDWSATADPEAPTEVDISPAAYTPATSEAIYTSTEVNNVVYVNRPDRVPWYRSKTAAGDFAEITVGATDWPTDTRCEVLRSFGGSLIALNMTEGSTSFPTKVKWSEFTSFDSLPADWDLGSSTSNSGENILSDLGEPITDGLPLKDRFFIYSATETWLMTLTGDNNVFDFKRLWKTNSGAISANCSVEIDGIHYVFGSNDIWFHDGVRRTSLATGAIREFVFDGLLQSQASQCFVHHNPTLKEIVFAYVSEDAYVAYPPLAYQGCNRAAVYNYSSKTWAFYDLPYVTTATLGAPFIGLTYAETAPGTYDGFGGSYAAQEDTTKPTTIMLSEAAGASLPSYVRTFDKPRSNTVAGTIDTAATKPSFLEMMGIDLDGLGDSIELRGYKVIRTIYPQMRLDSAAEAPEFIFGGSDYNVTQPTYSPGQTYDGQELYKLDYNTAGRYLAMKMTYDDHREFSLTGLDLDLVVTGAR